MSSRIDDAVPPDLNGAAGKPANPFLANFRPYIPASVTNVAEFRALPIIVGTLLGIIFGASSLYLVLKTGLTVSASIPVAVISITLFRLLSTARITRDATILENNVVQTAGSAGESIAFGVGVTMPAILILGFDLDFWRVMLVAVLGGLLGILMMIPLRRALIRDQHGILKYPEGTACAEVLKAGASAESRDVHREHALDKNAVLSDDMALQGGKIIGLGFVLGFIYKSFVDVFSLIKPEPAKDFGEAYRGGSVGLENNPALLGVGYIIGPYIAGIMMAGGVLSYLVLIPLIKYFGDPLTAPLAPETTKLISEMEPGDVRGAYVLYIGAGAVATAGIISLFRSLPTIWSGLQAGLADFRGSATSEAAGLERTDQDISMKWVIAGILALMAAIMLFPQLGLSVFQNPVVSFFGALMIIVFGFLFVTVSSRLTGQVGSSSNPISGMTVATLLFTCLIFLALGWTSRDPYFVTALSIGGIVCIAASNGGTTSQDLKTGFLVGGTPRRQQYAILIGALSSALILGPLLLWLNDAKTYYQPVDVAATFKSADFRVTPDMLAKDGGEFRGERAGGKYASDPATYRVWHNTDASLGQKGKYLINMQGQPAYFVDPTINGIIKKDEEGNDLERYDAPKATLMSYIIEGVLGQNLPWGLVLIGAFIAIALELSAIPALAFAVGLYLPLATSAPIFAGGIVRWLVDLYLRRKFAAQNMTEDQIIAETDKSNGVLLASGYIAGGAVAGILFALFAFIPTLEAIQGSFNKWAKTSNPFFAGDYSDILGLLPFLALAVFLYFVGRERIMTGRKIK
ncbi:MAG: oligopeptide transporter, OPT family [Acidobacteriota bacterium]|nr:oligopeptide transporter, OPT family [Acidobacteriota bacterium]